MYNLLIIHNKKYDYQKRKEKKNLLSRLGTSLIGNILLVGFVCSFFFLAAVKAQVVGALLLLYLPSLQPLTIIDGLFRNIFHA